MAKVAFGVSFEEALQIAKITWFAYDGNWYHPVGAFTKVEMGYPGLPADKWLIEINIQTKKVYGVVVSAVYASVFYEGALAVNLAPIDAIAPTLLEPVGTTNVYLVVKFKNKFGAS